MKLLAVPEDKSQKKLERLMKEAETRRCRSGVHLPTLLCRYVTVS
jgi:hypothetical protein